jgi:hypothetical protein
MNRSAIEPVPFLPNRRARRAWFAWNDAKAVYFGAVLGAPHQVEILGIDYAAPDDPSFTVIQVLNERGEVIGTGRIAPDGVATIQLDPREPVTSRSFVLPDDCGFTLPDFSEFRDPLTTTFDVTITR